MDLVYIIAGVPIVIGMMLYICYDNAWPWICGIIASFVFIGFNYLDGYDTFKINLNAEDPTILERTVIKMHEEGDEYDAYSNL